VLATYHHAYNVGKEHAHSGLEVNIQKIMEKQRASESKEAEPGSMLFDFL
jgi:hypothetical protein